MPTAAQQGPGPLFPWQFSLLTLLYAMTALCALLASCQLIEWRYAFHLAVCAFLPLSWCIAGSAIYLATRDEPSFLGLLTVVHLAIAVFLFVGPIVSYHINGRAWYDYGLSEWDPPVSQYPDGRAAISDYDPKFTPPAIWPMIGPVMYTMSWLSIGLIYFPPTAPVVAIAIPIMAARLRRRLTLRQKMCVWTIWVIGSLPTLYMLFWGMKVLDWIAD